MPSRSKKMAREVEIASSKRVLSDSEDSDDEKITRADRDNTSDWEEDAKQLKKTTKPPAKRQKTVKVEEKVTTSKRNQASTVVSDQIPTKIPEWAQCSPGVKLLSVRWWKEVSARDIFWEEFDKRIPKTVKAKRLSVHIAVALDDPDVKVEGADHEKPKARASRAPKKSALKVTNGVKTENEEKSKPIVVGDESDSSDESDDDFDTTFTKGLVNSPMTILAPKVIHSPKDTAENSPSVPKPAENRGRKTPKQTADSDGEEDCMIVSAGPSPSKKATKEQNLPDKNKPLPIHEGSAKTAGEVSKNVDENKRDSAVENTVVEASSETVKPVETAKDVAGESVEEIHVSIEHIEEQQGRV